MTQAPQNNCEVISGTVEKITYKNTQSAFTVIILSTIDADVCAVGSMPFINEGDNVTLEGEFVMHPTYGEQFKVSKCERNAPSTASAILRYLSGGSIKGVGPATATKIVECFGDKALEIIENDPQQLTRIRGISAEKAHNISVAYKEQFGIRDLMVYLSRFKVSPEKAIEIYKALGSNAITHIERNPYIICTLDLGMPFELCEQIAEYLGLPQDFYERILAGIEYVLTHNLGNGHTCLPEKKLCEAAARLLGCSVDTAYGACGELVLGLRLRSKEIDGENYIFLPKMYDAEQYIAARLTSIMNSNMQVNTVYDLEIEHIENMYSIKYDDNQKEAIICALSSKLLVLTGGPGTGKTTTLNGIITLLERQGQNVVLAAPTGRAAKRMTELTGKEAKTIHRLLEAGWDNGGVVFCRNEMNQLDGDVFVIDEMSMVDVLLFENFLRAVKPKARIILVGDSDQLPSVGAGNILYDIIACERIPYIRLTKVFRQALQSLIITNSHKIINGEYPDLTRKDGDFFMLNCRDSTEAVSKVVDLCVERLPNAYGFSPLSDIQVLCPSKVADLGTRNLNANLQNRINPIKSSSQKISVNGMYMIEGDKVIQTRNNYDVQWVKDNGTQDSGVYNGDIGIIEKINKAMGTVTVRFDDRVATYTSEDTLDLEPAYAITVHKSQGSEFECVVLPLFDTPKKLCYRNLLYTAVTRAKKLLVVVGRSEVLCGMVDNSTRALRYTSLCTQLKEKML